MSQASFLETEAGARQALEHGSRLIAAGWRRPWLTLAGSGLLTLLLLGALLWPQAYSPVYVIRVAEPANAPGNLPRIKRQLAEYVREGVLTSEPLLKVMRRHALY